VAALPLHIPTGSACLCQLALAGELRAHAWGGAVLPQGGRAAVVVEVVGPPLGTVGQQPLALRPRAQRAQVAGWTEGLQPYQQGVG